MGEYIKWGADIVLGLLGFLLWQILEGQKEDIKDAKKDASDANVSIDAVNESYHRFQIHVAETYVSRVTLNELVTVRFDRLERKVDELVRRKGE